MTFILMALGVAAVALLAGFTGGLPRLPPRSTENNGITPEPEREIQAAGNDDVVKMRVTRPPRPDRIIATMACATAVLVGALGVVTYRLTTCGGDQSMLQGAIGSSPAEATMVRLLGAAQATPARADTLLPDDHNAQAATAAVAMLAISEPPSHAVHEIRAKRRPTVGARKMAAVVGGYVTHSDRGIWLFPPDANGGG
jgi:hypothetical protein